MQEKRKIVLNKINKLRNEGLYFFQRAVQLYLKRATSQFSQIMEELNKMEEIVRTAEERGYLRGYVIGLRDGRIIFSPYDKCPECLSALVIGNSLTCPKGHEIKDLIEIGKYEGF